MDEIKEGRPERRACQRFKIPGATVNYQKSSRLRFFKSSSEEEFCPLVDISRGGLRFLVRQELPLETPLELEILIPGEQLPLKMKGKVRWIGPYEGKNYAYQVGVQFFPYGEKKGQNYPGNLVKIIALEQKFLEASPELKDENKDEFIV